ncbi:MAG: anti-sigma factor antagonist [Clostridiales bacterium]|nr:anti-sigma factor antagonist [Clostridiales bacterium]
MILERNKNLIVKIMGDIDQHNAEEIREKVDKAFERSRCGHMIFDFSGVAFMDSSGIGLLIGRYKNVRSRGGTVAIANMNHDLGRIYNISGLKKIIGSFDSLDQAEKQAENRRARA